MNDNLKATIIENIIPQFIRDEYPNFVEFIKVYYTHQDLEGEAYQFIANILDFMDVDRTTLEYLDNFSGMYLASFSDTLLSGITKRTLIKNIKQFYESAGSEKSFKFLFKILFDEDVDLYYPTDDVLRVSDGKWVNQSVIKISNNHDGEMVGLVGTEILGQTSGARGLVETVELYEASNGFLVAECGLSSLSPVNDYNEFLVGETVVGVTLDGQTTMVETVFSIITDVDVTVNDLYNYSGDIAEISEGSGVDGYVVVNSVESGGIESIEVIEPGSGYSVNDIIEFQSTSGRAAKGYVAAIDGSGGITSAGIVSTGHSYVNMPSYSIVSAGTGARLYPVSSTIGKIKTVDINNSGVNYLESTAPGFPYNFPLAFNFQENVITFYQSAFIYDHDWNDINYKINETIYGEISGQRSTIKRIDQSNGILGHLLIDDEYGYTADWENSLVDEPLVSSYFDGFTDGITLDHVTIPAGSTYIFKCSINFVIAGHTQIVVDNNVVTDRYFVRLNEPAFFVDDALGGTVTIDGIETQNISEGVHDITWSGVNNTTDVFFKLIGENYNNGNHLESNMWDMELIVDGITIFSNFLAQNSHPAVMKSEVGPDITFTNDGYNLYYESDVFGHKWVDYSESTTDGVELNEDQELLGGFLTTSYQSTVANGVINVLSDDGTNSGVRIDTAVNVGEIVKYSYNIIENNNNDELSVISNPEMPSSVGYHEYWDIAISATIGIKRKVGPTDIKLDYFSMQRAIPITGSERLTDGDFKNWIGGYPDAWAVTEVPGQAYSEEHLDGVRLYSDGNGATIQQTGVFEIGKSYKIIFTKTNTILGSIRWRSPEGYALELFPGDTSGDGVFSTYVTATVDNLIIYSTVGGCDYVFKAEVQEIAFDKIPAGPEIEQTENLVKYSETFDHSDWFKYFTTITPNTINDPNGNLYTDKLVEEASNNLHTLQFNFGDGLVDETLYSSSVYLKYGGRQYVQLRFGRGSNFTLFDLVGGTFVDTNSSVGSMEDVGDGWFKCTVTAPVENAGSENNFLHIRLSDGGAYTYLGDGVSGVYVWGAQANIGDEINRYVYTSTEAVSYPLQTEVDVLESSLTNPGADSIGAVVKPAKLHTLDYDYTIYLKTPSVLSNKALIGPQVGYEGLVIRINEDGKIELINSNSNSPNLISDSVLSVDTDYIIRVLGDNTDSSLYINSVLDTTDPIVYPYDIGSKIQFGGAHDGQFWDGLIYRIQSSVNDVIANDWVFYSSNISNQKVVYDIIGTDNAAISDEANIPFFTEEAATIPEIEPDGIELWDSGVATLGTGWSYDGAYFTHSGTVQSEVTIENQLIEGEIYSYYFEKTAGTHLVLQLGGPPITDNRISTGATNGVFSGSLPAESVSTVNKIRFISNADGAIFRFNVSIQKLIHVDIDPPLQSSSDVNSSFFDGEEIIGEVSGAEGYYLYKQFDTSGSIVPGSISDYSGYYRNTDGFVSGDKYIQDSYYYQDFSYAITTLEDQENWIGPVKDMLHPAGTIVFGFSARESEIYGYSDGGWISPRLNTLEFYKFNWDYHTDEDGVSTGYSDTQLSEFQDTPIYAAAEIREGEYEEDYPNGIIEGESINTLRKTNVCFGSKIQYVFADNDQSVLIDSINYLLIDSTNTLLI